MPGRFASPRDFLDELLQGGAIAPSDVDEIIRDFREEGQHHDFKDGQITTSKSQKDLNLEVVRYVTGFANAEGGVLVLGVSEGKERRVTGVTAPGTSPISEWATRVLSRVMGVFSPLPRVFPVEHSAGNVLLIAVGPAPEYISYIERGEPKYAMRFGDSTRDIPAFLLTDLLLGRRRHPVLGLRPVEIKEREAPPASPLRFRAALHVENLSFLPSEETEVGAVSWSLEGPQTLAANSLLLQHVEAQQPTNPFEALNDNSSWKIIRYPADGSGKTIKPFEVVSYENPIARLPRVPPTGSVQFGIYLMPKGSQPTWYEVSCRYSVVDGKLDPHSIKSDRVMGRRPRIRWGNW